MSDTHTSQPTGQRDHEELVQHYEKEIERLKHSMSIERKDIEQEYKLEISAVEEAHRTQMQELEDKHMAKQVQY